MIPDEVIIRAGTKLFAHTDMVPQLEAVLRVAKDTINVLWVSHHANRADYALELIDNALRGE